MSGLLQIKSLSKREVEEFLTKCSNSQVFSFCARKCVERVNNCFSGFYKINNDKLRKLNKLDIEKYSDVISAEMILPEPDEARYHSLSLSAVKNRFGIFGEGVNIQFSDGRTAKIYQDKKEYHLEGIVDGQSSRFDLSYFTSLSQTRPSLS